MATIPLPPDFSEFLRLLNEREVLSGTRTLGIGMRQVLVALKVASKPLGWFLLPPSTAVVHGLLAGLNGELPNPQQAVGLTVSGEALLQNMRVLCCERTKVY